MTNAIAFSLDKQITPLQSHSTGQWQHLRGAGKGGGGAEGKGESGDGELHGMNRLANQKIVSAWRDLSTFVLNVRHCSTGVSTALAGTEMNTYARPQIFAPVSGCRTDRCHEK